MKTSNKILIGLLVVIFTVPVMLAASLRSKIKKGEYTIQKYDDIRSGSFTAFKVVQVIAPDPRLLRCHLKLSDKMSYKYDTDSEDSITVFTANDTLYIKYIAQQPKGDMGDLEIYVNLPAFNNIVVDGAYVILDSLSASSALSLTLKNNGIIKDGSKKREDENAKVLPADNLKKENVLQTAQTNKVVTIDSDTEKFSTFKNPKLLYLPLFYNY